MTDETQTDQTPAQRPEGLPDDYWDAEKNSLRMDAILPRLGPAQRPEALPEAYWNAEKGELNFDALGPRLAAGVSKVDEIDWTLPGDLDPSNPDVVWEISKDDPMVKAMGEVFAAQGLQQSAITALTTAYAKHSLSQMTEMRNALTAEAAKLGPKSAERVSGAQKFVEDTLVRAAGTDPKAIAAAKQRAENFRNTWTTAEQVEVVEALIKAASAPQPNTGAPASQESESKGRRFFAGMTQEKAN
ncbi:MAG: hypothetical protein E6R03_12180 [Hyphomicrobiaceae bacterium]|nr:MAG: hypothetical protein E6R03_12180 [Hyphomicrobiaceae bacterium]